MADFATGLRTRLIGNVPVAAVLGTKVFWVIVPQDTPLQYIRLQTISDPRPQTLRGYDRARQVRVQADCFGRTYAEARGLAKLVIAATAEPAIADGIRFGRTKAVGPRDLGEDTDAGFIHNASVDLLIEHLSNQE